MFVSCIIQCDSSTIIAAGYPIVTIYSELIATIVTISLYAMVRMKEGLSYVKLIFKLRVVMMQ